MSFTQSAEFSCQPPSLLNSLREISAPIDWLSTVARLPSLMRAPKGDGRPVLLAPGYLADEYSMWPLKQFLQRINYDVYDWGLGRNLGNVDKDIVRLGNEVIDIHTRGKQPITLIGWSLGGVVAREVTRLFPEAVAEVITLGTPITGGPKYTAVANQYAKAKNLDLDSFEQHVLERNLIGFEQPVTSIFSKTDGVVGWKASVDVYNKQARNICVKGSHLGLGINPQVWKIIADTLAGK